MPTIESSIQVKINPYCPKQEYELPGKGVKGARHVAVVKIRVPRGNLDDEITQLIKSLQTECEVDDKHILGSGSRIKFMQEAPTYLTNETHKTSESSRF